jgi:hypothetical protein
MRHRVALAIVLWFVVLGRAYACEPIVPFMMAVAPTVALAGSIVVLAAAVIVKSALFAFFERRLPRVRAAWRMFVGNLLTSSVGLLVAAMIGNGPAWIFGIPIVAVLCWLPSRRLVKAAPLRWLAKVPAGAMAAMLTVAFVASCILFALGQVAIQSERLALYWLIKVAAIFLALLASVTLTTIWEEWVIWRMSSRPEGAAFFSSVLRTNLYVLILVMIVPAAIMLPRRLKSPDFLVQRTKAIAAQTTAVCLSHK